MYEQLVEHKERLWAALAQVLTAFDEFQQRLDPESLPRYSQELAPLARALESALENSGSWAGATGPESDAQDGSSGSILRRAAIQALQACARFQSSESGPHQILKAFQSLRPLNRAHEIAYALSSRVEEVSRHFLGPSRSGDQPFLERLSSVPDAAAERGDVRRGLIHAKNGRAERGGYSLYVPEYYSPDIAWPLVVALHGGSGHGADFLWSWLREARSFGFLLAAPTSQGRTWSLRAPSVDAVPLNRMLADISERYRVDTGHILLNGISDGGTFSMLLAIAKQTPFTHFAPVASAIHVLLNSRGEVEAPVAGLPIYLVHGGRDWMFPVAKARLAADGLRRAGANLTYREIEELSHNYPRDENARMLEWFQPQFRSV